MDSIITRFLGFLADVGGTLGKIKIAGLSNNNWMVPVFALFIIFLAGFTLGRSRIVIATFCIYAAYFIETHFPYFAQVREALKNVPAYWLHVGLFVILLMVIFGILNRSLLRRKLCVKDASIFQILLLAILNVGFLFSVIVSYLPPTVELGLPAEILRLFNTKTAQIVWAILPIVAVLFIRSKKEPSTILTSKTSKTSRW